MSWKELAGTFLATTLVIGGVLAFVQMLASPGKEIHEYPTGKLVRVVDCEAEVVCFRYVGFEGVSCVPLSQTPLCCTVEE